MNKKRKKNKYYWLNKIKLNNRLHHKYAPSYMKVFLSSIFLNHKYFHNICFSFLYSSFISSAKHPLRQIILPCHTYRHTSCTLQVQYNTYLFRFESLMNIFENVIIVDMIKKLLNGDDDDGDGNKEVGK